MSQSEYEESVSESSEVTEKPIKYKAQFYLTQDLRSFNGDQLMQITRDFELVKSSTIQFGPRPESANCAFNGKRYRAEVGDMFDAPQLYKTFKVGGRYFGQVLFELVEFLESSVVVCDEIPGLEVQSSEYGYARLAPFKQGFLGTNGREIFQYSLEAHGDVAAFTPISVHKNPKADYMLFTYEKKTIAFELNAQRIYRVNQEGNDQLILEPIVELENQQVLFQGRNLIVSDGQYPTPEIEAFDLKTEKVVKLNTQNWFQDNFWDYLQIQADGRLELDAEALEAIKNPVWKVPEEQPDKE